MRHVILGTAGHVDHGKTELVRALTGRDTDRLKEEKARGISIELGFAPLAVGDDTFIGIIDVPGHERFVKHMVSGAGGVDVAMLLVAADEGVMPQTEEHMEVLKSLEIAHGLVVVSKCDLASPDTMEILREEIDELTRGTFLEGAPVVETSARTGDGIEALRRTLGEIAARVDEPDSTGPFRLAVDRVFHRKGIGVVITGTAYSGSVGVGESLELLPAGRRVRVRELQSFGEKHERGGAGERLALALQGVRLEEVHRGDMLATPGAFAASEAIDVRLELAGYYDFEVKNRERVRIHHGAREVMGRVILLDVDTVGAGGDALAQIRLEAPLVCATRDRFVLRKYSPPRVIGGGAVIDPRPERHKRFDDDTLEQVRLKEAGEPDEVLAEAIARTGIAGLPRVDADPELAAELAASGRVVEVAGRWLAGPVVVSLAEQVDDRVCEYLARNPLRWGMPKEELRQRIGYPHPTQAFNALLDVLAVHRPLFIRENWVRSGSPELILAERDQARVNALAETIRERGVAFPSVGDLTGAWEGPEPIQDALQLLRDRGEVTSVGEDGVIHGESVARVIETLRGLFAGADDVGVGDVKDALGLSRKHAIPLLEMLDANDVTTRVGNRRRRGAAFPD
jgi:selenocysteine-specific elongation factor